MANVTALYTGLCAILIIYLAVRVAQFRRTKKVGMGTGNDLFNEIRVRVHANAIEYIPIALLLLLVAELGDLARVWLHILALHFFCPEYAMPMVCRQARAEPIWDVSGAR